MLPQARFQILITIQEMEKLMSIRAKALKIMNRPPTNKSKLHKWKLLCPKLAKKKQLQNKLQLEHCKIAKVDHQETSKMYTRVKITIIWFSRTAVPQKLKHKLVEIQKRQQRASVLKIENSNLRKQTCTQKRSRLKKDNQKISKIYST